MNWAIRLIFSSQVEACSRTLELHMGWFHKPQDHQSLRCKHSGERQQW